MRILITGNMGYVGPAVTAQLREHHPGAELIGYDTGLFASALTTTGPAPETRLDAQRFGDVRDITAADLVGCDAVVHLAAISNDPIGNRFAAITDAINRAASLRLADSGARRESDATGPLTAYARSKVATEDGLRQRADERMTVTCLRFATACGISDRLRLDLVLNDFVACALTSGKITVLSDGTPWRPLIDVADMARAIDWACFRAPENGGRMLVVNAGADARNHQVRDLAHAVAAAVPGAAVSINTAAPHDSRSYRVDFALFRALAPDHQPRVDLAASIAGLVAGLRGIGFADAEFRHSPRLIRLNTVAALMERGALSPDLRWAWRGAAAAAE